MDAWKDRTSKINPESITRTKQGKETGIRSLERKCDF
jgi:hypothetical protein